MNFRSHPGKLDFSGSETVDGGVNPGTTVPVKGVDSRRMLHRKQSLLTPPPSSCVWKRARVPRGAQDMSAKTRIFASDPPMLGRNDPVGDGTYGIAETSPAHPLQGITSTRQLFFAGAINKE